MKAGGAPPATPELACAFLDAPRCPLNEGGGRTPRNAAQSHMHATGAFCALNEGGGRTPRNAVRPIGLSAAHAPRSMKAGGAPPATLAR